MLFDLSSCEIRTPETPQELRRLYEMLADVFPVEKKLFEDVISGITALYNWKPHTLYYGDEPVGNVSTVMFQLQAEGRLQKIAGIASVATPERYRGMGIAKHLMNHVLKVIDAQDLPGILFTSLPRVYTGLGYQPVNQAVKQTVAGRLGQINKLPVQRVTHLTRDVLDTIKKLYCENLIYDGKLLRDEEYWRLYGNAVNNCGRTEFALCNVGGKVSGYARLEYESDRALLDEFYTSGESPEINAALWNQVCDAAAEKGKHLVSIALPLMHPLWNFLQVAGLAVEPETGVEREVFMARMPRNESISWLAGLQWPLSDKF